MFYEKVTWNLNGNAAASGNKKPGACSRAFYGIFLIPGVTVFHGQLGCFSLEFTGSFAGFGKKEVD